MSDFKFISNFLGKKANLPKDGHDMSAQFAYSQPFANINVVDYLNVVPNEHYKCKYDGYVQSAPMREDNFATIYNNMKAVFIPYTSLSRNYLNSAFGELDGHVKKNPIYDIPAANFLVNMEDFILFFFPTFFVSKLFEAVYSLPDIDQFYWEQDEGTYIALLDGQGSPKIISTYYSTNGSLPVSLDILLRYITLTHVGGNRKSYLVHEMENLASALRTRSGNFICFDAMRLLDSFDFGNLLPAIEYVHSVVVNNIGLYSGMQICSSNSFTADFISFVKTALHGNSSTALWGDGSSSARDIVNVLPLFAYQYYVQMCESSNYRNPNDLNVITPDTIAAYSKEHPTNTWLIPDSTFANIHIKPSFDSGIPFTAYRNYDGFDMSSLDTNTFSLFTFLLQQQVPLLYPDLFTSAQTQVIRGSMVTTTAQQINANPTLDIHQKSALYKLREDLLRAGVRRDKQMQSIFGVSPEVNVLDDIFVLDKSQSVLNIQSLLNQAETDVAPLGARGARGNGKCGLDFEFNSKDFGIILIVQYFTLEPFYESFGQSKFVKSGFSSIWNPRYNNLGLEAIYRRECSIYDYSFGYAGGSGMTDTIGYSARYYEYKQRRSMARGAFTNFGMPVSPYGSDVPSDSIYVPKFLSRGSASFGGYVPTLIDQQVLSFVNSQQLRFSPFMTNNLFTIQFDGAGFASAAYDPFRCVLNANIRKVSSMPKLGLLRQI